MKLSVAMLSTASACCLATAAFAGAIVAPTSAVINSGGPGFGPISNTHDQSCLSAGYTSGVTDFDTYLATSPTHSPVFSGCEWFSNNPSSSAQVTYDLGSAMTIDALALWNEESSGIGLLDLLGSLDNITFFALASGLLPTDNPNINAPYLADQFSFSSMLVRYVRFDMSNCPQQPSTFTACAIGEVAFRVADGGQVPEPAALALLGMGILGLGMVRRRKA